MRQHTTAVNIVDQLGGHGFLRATRSSICTANNNAVALRLCQTTCGANRLTIWRTMDDRYNVRLFFVSGNAEPDVKAAVKDVQPIKLLQTVNELTGFDYWPRLRA